MLVPRKKSSRDLAYPLEKLTSRLSCNVKTVTDKLGTIFQESNAKADLR